jgi:hypothetical protein
MLVAFRQLPLPAQSMPSLYSGWQTKREIGPEPFGTERRPRAAKPKHFKRRPSRHGDKEVVKELLGTIPILRSLPSKMGVSPSPGQFFHNLKANGQT